MTANGTAIHQSSNKVNVGICRQPYIRLPSWMINSKFYRPNYYEMTFPCVV